MDSSIDLLRSVVKDSRIGLPEEVFLFISELTPLVNVDLLVKNDQHRTLLTWREDGFYAPGWHLPGGIIRFKETAVDRVRAVARSELGAEVEFDLTPLTVREVIQSTRNVRGHLISLLFRCSLLTPPDEELRFESGRPKPGEWSWHSTCPPDILEAHRAYASYL